MKALVIEDDMSIVESIIFTFEAGWPEMQILTARHGEEGLEIIEKDNPKLVILDIGLPDINGFEVLKRARLFSNVPIIILTVRGDEESIVKGLQMGADEYIVKPFKPLELIVRIKKVLKHSPFSESNAELCLNYGQTIIYIYDQKVIINGKTIRLTNTESVILSYLINNAGIVVPNQSIAEQIWGSTYPGYKKAIRVYIRHLRKKLKLDEYNLCLLLTHPKTGYSWVKPH